MNNPCTLCQRPGIPGLIRRAGKCQYHWNVGVYGQAWADQLLIQETLMDPAELDNKIVEAIRAGDRSFTAIYRTLTGKSHPSAKAAITDRMVDRRLQALRRKGQIVWLGTRRNGWHLSETAACLQ